LVGIQFLVACVNFSIYAGGAPLQTLLVSDWALALIWQGQLLILSTATTHAQRAPMGRFWLAFAGVTLASVVAARFI